MLTAMTSMILDLTVEKSCFIGDSVTGADLMEEKYLQAPIILIRSHFYFSASRICHHAFRRNRLDLSDMLVTAT
ncbi:MAG: hypothetical protein EPN59_16770 [Paraburkholderia sp.]|uniref:hypothetical protein n=1 Tax=Paraburkholderia sp. TaxID=1926495 RepID=UPI0012029026|nr:hypothetical protein [Paraburkholderia sp.]TAM27849.1 MAG: hypothetical protein EPN59_16770 [Paraburkholderia sp.]